MASPPRSHLRPLCERHHARDLAWGRTDDFLPNQFLANVNPSALPFWLAGLYFVFFAAAGKRFRVLGWAYLVAFILFGITRGRFYYIAPAYPMLLAAGAVWLVRWAKQKRGTIRSRRARSTVGGRRRLRGALGVASRTDQLAALANCRRDE